MGGWTLAGVIFLVVLWDQTLKKSWKKESVKKKYDPELSKGYFWVFFWGKYFKTVISTMSDYYPTASSIVQWRAIRLGLPLNVSVGNMTRDCTVENV